ncbi:MAG: LysM peptidoglycan-binding domain-containing protein [Anaerolineae bacterium]|nr:LysM peptidoglycan-binding domain-containing protein [Anaerolineae bacterium]
MRRLLVLGSLLLTLGLPLVTHADSPTHLVAYGETLYSIARQYGVSPADLASANGVTIDSWVYAGQRLAIPGDPDSTEVSADATSQVALASPGGTYTVRAGDTLYSVSRQFGVSVNSIADANNIPPNGFLYTGWTLKIPGAGSAPSAASDALSKPAAPLPANSESSAPAASAQSPKTTISYIVRAGDTLYGIAISHGVTMAAIRIANNLPTPFVYTGQRLSIPNTESASTLADNSPKSAVSPGLLASVEGIPVYKQEQTLTCEQSAAAMALRGALSEQEIVAAMPHSENPFEGIRGETNYGLLGGLTHYGTYAQGLQKGLKKLGRQSTAYHGQSYDQFKSSIIENLKQGRPVIWWTTWRETAQTPQWVELSTGIKIPLTPYEHAVVIVSATDQGVTYHDPYDGTVRFTTWANHKRASGYFNNMALVIF